MIEVLRKTITISTSEGDYNLTFCPAIPKGYEKLMLAVHEYIQSQEMSSAVAKDDKVSGAVHWIVKQAELAEKFIEAIKETVDKDSLEAVGDVLYHISVESLLRIVSSLLKAYTDYFDDRIKEMKEGFEP